MRRLIIAYLMLTAGLCGWLIATFGLGYALFGTFIFALPIYVAWRIVSNDRPARKREYGYLGALACLALVATGFLIGAWYSYDLDSRVIFDRECRELRDYIARNPEYKDVEIYWGCRKGCGVTLQGSVHSIRLYENLIQQSRHTVHYGGIYDQVEYPEKPDKDELSLAE